MIANPNHVRNFLIQFPVVVLFVLFPVITGPKGIGELFQWPPNPFVIRDLFHYILLTILFYANYHLLVPRLYFTRRLGWYFFILSGLLIFFLIIPGDLFLWGDHIHFRPPHGPHGFPPPPRHNGIFNHHFRQIFFPFLLVVLLSLILRIQARLRESEAKKLNAELSLLKAQINPHFLFNTLNGIYALALEGSNKTASAIVRLSGLMRYVTTEATSEWVPLEKELGYISDYVELQRLRLGDTIEVVFSIKNETNGKLIAPLILISFVENAFKHGIGPSGEGKIRIDISATENELHLQVFNNKVLKSSALEWEKNGLGLPNTKERLKRLYGQNHRLEIQDMSDTFQVDLKLNLK